jgi:protein-disulfide isomerase
MRSKTRSLRAAFSPPAVVALLAVAVLLALGACAAQPLAPAESPAAAATTTAEEPAADAATENVTDTAAVTGTETTTETAAPAPPPDLGLTQTGTYKDMPVGFTADGLPFRGALDAPLVMHEYSDFHCPFCARHFVQTEPAINESYVQEGKLAVVFHDFPLVDLHPGAPAAHVAALCIADQSAELYWAMHDQLFRTQTESSNSLDAAPVYARLAEEVGADVDAFNECVAAGEKQPVVQERVDEAQSLGFSGTPSFRFVNMTTGDTYDVVGAQPYDVFAQTIDTMLAGEVPAAPEQPEQPSAEIPFWASAEGLAPDPERPGYDVAGDLIRGSQDAQVTVIEYSDFQCPYCKQHFDETQPVLDENYVDTGQVKWVFKHFPLDIHPQAPAAAVASECAAEQGQFWEMHHLLFENVESWSVSEPNPVFVGLAEELGLDTGAFESCLADPVIAERVDSDVADGAPYVSGTPSFIVLFGGQGTIIPGALPADRFQQVLDEILAQVEGGTQQ